MIGSLYFQVFNLFEVNQLWDAKNEIGWWCTILFYSGTYTTWKYLKHGSTIFIGFIKKNPQWSNPSGLVNQCLGVKNGIGLQCTGIFSSEAHIQLKDILGWTSFSWIQINKSSMEWFNYPLALEN